MFDKKKKTDEEKLNQETGDEGNLESKAKRQEKIIKFLEKDDGDLNFIDSALKDHKLARRATKLLLLKALQTYEDFSEDWEDAPSPRTVEAMALLIDRINGLVKQLLDNNKQLTEIRNNLLKKMEDDERRKNMQVVIDKAIIVGNVDDIIALKDKKTAVITEGEIIEDPYSG